LRVDLAGTLAQAEQVILPRELSERAGPLDLAPGARLRVGADLGTAYLVLVVLVGGVSAFPGMAGVVEEIGRAHV
jgi:hypothetical protein